ncbi:MAG: hypothetical protein LBT00_04900 [Spirochaetaceae bacterium]|nr:hypothetical protein [Spirochaetaceae bacterium]
MSNHSAGEIFRAMRYGSPCRLPLAKQHPSPSVIASERHIAERSNRLNTSR